MTTCRTELVRQAAAILISMPMLTHEWRNEPNRAVLFIPTNTPDGFDITLAASDADIELTAGRFHSPFDHNPNPEDFIAHALGFVRDLLSPSMRLRELVAGNVPYRWFLESRQGDRWVSEEEMGLLFWPFWAQRSERIYMNHQLTARS